MNNVRKSVIQVFFLIVLLVIAGSVFFRSRVNQENILDSIHEDGLLKVGIRTDNPPHSFIDTNGRVQGFDVDIANAIAQEMSLSIEIVPVDELTRISYLESRIIDIAVASMSHTKTRDDVIDFSITYFWSFQSFLVKKGTVEDLSQLINQKVGVTRGSHATDNWRNWLYEQGVDKEPTILEFTNKQAAVEAVRQGYIMGWAEDYEVLISYALANPDLEVLDIPIGYKYDGIGMLENQSDLRDAINFTLQELFKSGKYSTIYDKWFGVSTQTYIPIRDEFEVWP